jgi:hypothetical protein
MAVACTCLNCGNVFFKFASRIAVGKGKFCSKRCVYSCRPKIPLVIRFGKYAAGRPTDSGCVLWTGALNAAGYGTIGRGAVHEGKILAHRLAWELINGPIPDGLEICHDCPGGDNPRCVNPDHMFLGTHLDNVADCFAKGRQARGEKQGGSKITEDIVVDIRKRVDNGESRAAVAADLDLLVSHVTKIAARKSWRHVP